MIMNFGSLFLALLFIPVQILFLRFIRSFPGVFTHCMHYIATKYDSMIWNGLISVFNETYFLLVLTAKLNFLILFEDNHWASILNSVLALVTEAVCIVLPLVLYWLYKKHWNVYAETRQEWLLCRQFYKSYGE